MKHEKHNQGSYPKTMDDFELDSDAETVVKAGMIKRNKKRWPAVQKRMEEKMAAMKGMMDSMHEEEE